MNSLVSVIIPVYKVEQYLSQCVDSILAQTYQNIEIILVDDGSPDNSGAICDEYAKKDARVKVIHKENGGLSSARNAGLDVAGGKYIQFIDSDDYLCDMTCIEKLVGKMESEGDDFVLFKTMLVYPEQGKLVDNDGDFDLEAFETEDSADVLRYMVAYNKPVASAWNKMVRKAIIIDNHLYFKNGIIAEDIDWNIRLFRVSKRIGAVNQVFHHYRKENPNSITATGSEKSITDLYHTIQEQSALAKEGKDKFSEAVLAFMAFHYAILLINIVSCKKIEKFKNVTDYDWLLKYAADKKTKCVKYLYRIFGFKNGIKMAVLLLECVRRLKIKCSR